MKVILRGPLAQGAARRELRLSFGRAVKLEEVLASLAEQVPSVRHYLSMNVEAGHPPSLLVISSGHWVYPGDVLEDEAELEVHPPIQGG
ncbi:MAG: MoaD/ThiS family protein [Chloroflexi bacterium]|nr:MoaD/ThiS family protein [Chloroflexota bacterium]